MTTRYNTPKPLGCSKSRSKRKVYIQTSPPQETRKSSNKQAHFTSKAARDREEQTRPKVSRRKEIIKIRAASNEIETNKKNRKDQ